MTTSPEGLDLDALDRHLRSEGIPRSGDLRAELISGGRSNLTFLIADDASKWVLRRPPLHGLTPSAHDMAREYTVVAALQDTAVPVARAVTMRNDDSVLGAPFQMVEYVPGRVIRHTNELEALGGKDEVDACGDYRIDNTMLDAADATKVLAVLDWEMSTLGDPISDAALMCVYRHPMFNLVHADAAWASPLIPTADELAQRYSAASGQSLDHWEFYMGLAYFKLAIIAAGIAYRGRVGGAAPGFVTMVDDAVAPLIAAGLEWLKI